MRGPIATAPFRTNNSTPKLVASTTLTNPTWNNATVLSDDLVAAVRALKQHDGGPILMHGSRRLEARRAVDPDP